MRTTLLIMAVLWTRLHMPRPVKRRPAHRPGEGTVRFRALADRIQVESQPGRHALIEEEPAEAMTVAFDRPLFCGQPVEPTVEQDGVILHKAPDVFWPDSGDLGDAGDTAVAV